MTRNNDIILAADNLTEKQYAAVLPFFEMAVELEPLLGSYPSDYAVGPPFPVKEWQALLAAFRK